MSVFVELLSIKTFRESKADIAVTRQRGVLAKAETDREAAHASLTEFVDYALRHERALYDDLCQRLVKLHDIEDVQLAVADLRNRERQHEAALAAAEKQRQSEAEALEQRKLERKEAARNKQKFVELAQVYADEAIKALERKEDAEMEEASEVRRERADWGDDEEGA